MGIKMFINLAFTANENLYGAIKLQVGLHYN